MNLQDVGSLLLAAVSLGMFIVNVYQASTNRTILKAQQAISVTPCLSVSKQGVLSLDFDNSGPGVVTALNGVYWYAQAHPDEPRLGFDRVPPFEEIPFKGGAIGVGRKVAIELEYLSAVKSHGNALGVYWNATNSIGKVTHSPEPLFLLLPEPQESGSDDRPFV